MNRRCCVRFRDGGILTWSSQFSQRCQRLIKICICLGLFAAVLHRRTYAIITVGRPKTMPQLQFVQLSVLARDVGMKSVLFSWPNTCTSGVSPLTTSLEVAQAKCLGFGNRSNWISPPGFGSSSGNIHMCIYLRTTSTKASTGNSHLQGIAFTKKLPPGVWLIECINIVNGIQMKLQSAGRKQIYSKCAGKKSTFEFIEHRLTYWYYICILWSTRWFMILKVNKNISQTL